MSLIKYILIVSFFIFLSCRNYTKSLPENEFQIIMAFLDSFDSELINSNPIKLDTIYLFKELMPFNLDLFMTQNSFILLEQPIKNSERLLFKDIKNWQKIRILQPSVINQKEQIKEIKTSMGTKDIHIDFINLSRPVFNKSKDTSVLQLVAGDMIKYFVYKFNKVNSTWEEVRVITL